MNEHKTILIIDDEHTMTDSVESAFEGEPFTFHVAHSGAEGLEKAFAEKPDLILLDVQMPDMSGIEVLKQLRADEWGKSVIVIMMTVADETEHIADAVEQGVDSYILKSDIELSDLVANVKEKLA